MGNTFNSKSSVKLKYTVGTTANSQATGEILKEIRASSAANANPQPIHISLQDLAWLSRHQDQLTDDAVNSNIAKALERYCPDFRRWGKGEGAAPTSCAAPQRVRCIEQDAQGWVWQYQQSSDYNCPNGEFMVGIDFTKEGGSWRTYKQRIRVLCSTVYANGLNLLSTNTEERPPCSPTDYCAHSCRDGFVMTGFNSRHNDGADLTYQRSMTAKCQQLKAISDSYDSVEMDLNDCKSTAPYRQNTGADWPAIDTFHCPANYAVKEFNMWHASGQDGTDKESWEVQCCAIKGDVIQQGGC